MSDFLIPHSFATPHFWFRVAFESFSQSLALCHFGLSLVNIPADPFFCSRCFTISGVAVPRVIPSFRRCLGDLLIGSSIQGNRTFVKGSPSVPLLVKVRFLPMLCLLDCKTPAIDFLYHKGVFLIHRLSAVCRTLGRSDCNRSPASPSKSLTSSHELFSLPSHWE